MKLVLCYFKYFSTILIFILSKEQATGNDALQIWEILMRVEMKEVSTGLPTLSNSVELRKQR